jgi:hexosaminidase
MLTRFASVAFLLLLYFSAFSQQIPSFGVPFTNRYTIIPRPAQLEPRSGEFAINRTTTIQVPSTQTDLKAIADTFATKLSYTIGIHIQVQTAAANTGSNTIHFVPTSDTTLGLEGYRIDITDKIVTVEAATANGFFYATQTLYQLAWGKGLRAEGMNTQPSSTIIPLPTAPTPLLYTPSLPACRIQDQPRYKYRGLHLDVCRHFFSVAFIKKYVDIMALHKFNTFHWHLTDDQGWRIEIKKYPRLTQIGSHRRETIIGHYDDYDPQVFDGKPYGGFYTQDDIREVIRYAAAKYVTVVPEIELPGHALAALAAYPNLACSPSRDYQVSTKWGVFDDVFCPTEKTFAFLEDVLTEVIDLFPSPYIHIGGDECPKTVWRNNAYCQQLIRRLKLKNMTQLQRYFIKRIDQFVSAKGRRIIGWDEMLEGDGPKLGLSPNATVMSWRSIKAGITAARQHHDVIMTPGLFCYFDHYQGDPASEPTGFGGSLPLEKVYSYNPTPAELSPADAKHILGTQGNLWTEYIPTPDQVEYMIWPRAAALAEVAWTPSVLRNYDDFIRRLLPHIDRLHSIGVNVSRTFFKVLPSAKPTPDGHVEISLPLNQQQASIPGLEVRYTLDGHIPSGESHLYEKPFTLTKSAVVRTVTFRQGRPLSSLAAVQKEYLVSKATGKPYTLLNSPTSGRPDRNYSLTDGTTGDMGGYEVMGVVAFKSDFDAVVDLGQMESIQSIRIGFLKYTARNICLPKQVEISVSEDGKTFRSALIAKTNAAEGGKRAVVRLPFDFNSTTARYVRLVARKVDRVPAGLRNPGKTAQLAVDEIEIR